MRRSGRGGASMDRRGHWWRRTVEEEWRWSRPSQSRRSSGDTCGRRERQWRRSSGGLRWRRRSINGPSVRVASIGSLVIPK